MHTKVFGRYEGGRDNVRYPTYTEINVIGNYAPATKATVTVVDAGGAPVDSACVEFKLYNYAEFYTVATKYTSAGGVCDLTAGKGICWYGRQRTDVSVLPRYLSASNRN